MPIQTPSVVVNTPIGNESFDVTSTNLPNIPVDGSVSGTTDSSGPWFIETQWATFYYIRMPKSNKSMMQDSNLNLSAVAVVSGDIASTELIVQGQFYVTRVKSFDTYSYSSMQQPQKFTLYPNYSDFKGNTYGTSAVFSGNTNNQPLGPMGHIITNQKYVSRRVYVSGAPYYDDNRLGSSSIEGFNFQFTRSLPSCQDSSYTAKSRARDFFYDHQGWLGSFGGWQDLRENHVGVSSLIPIYVLPGGYNYTQEQYIAKQELINLIDTMSVSVATYGYPGQSMTGGQGSLLWDGSPLSTGYTNQRAPLFSDYDANRHDYS